MSGIFLFWYYFNGKQGKCILEILYICNSNGQVNYETINTEYIFDDRF